MKEEEEEENKTSINFGLKEKEFLLKFTDDVSLSLE
jgi:hypothetical protein